MTTALGRMQGVLSGRPATIPAVAPHWYGYYKQEVAGRGDTEESANPYGLYGEEHAAIDELFYQEFRPDWFQCTLPNPRMLPERFGSAEYRRIAAAIKTCDGRSAVDEYIALTTLSETEIRATGQFDHVEVLAKRHGDRVFIAPNEGNPVCDLFDPHGLMGFETGLISLLTEPDFMAYLLHRLYEQRLERVRFMAGLGCHGYIGSETYCGADLISPDVCRGVIMPAQTMLNTGIRQVGLFALSYYCGDINPLIGDIGAMGIHGLLIEESKKAFTLDAVEVRKRLNPAVALFGNLDSVTVLLDGTAEEVAAATRRQMTAARHGPFVMANGSPLALGTPRQNLRAMMDAARAA